MSPTQDPLLTAIDAYQKSLAAIDAEPDAPGEKGAQNAIAYNSNMKALESWATPAKSRAGAIEALRLAKEEAGVFFDDPLIFSMIGAALSYLEHHDA